MGKLIQFPSNDINIKNNSIPNINKDKLSQLIKDKNIMNIIQFLMTESDLLKIECNKEEDICIVVLICDNYSCASWVDRDDMDIAVLEICNKIMNDIWEYIGDLSIHNIGKFRTGKWK